MRPSHGMKGREGDKNGKKEELSGTNGVKGKKHGDQTRYSMQQAAQRYIKSSRCLASTPRANFSYVWVARGLQQIVDC